MDEQPALFYEDIYDALGADIRTLGLGLDPQTSSPFKTVAQWLWRTRKAETAYARLKACLDDSKPETHLNPEELLAIKQKAAEFGGLATVRYEAQECSLTQPLRVEPEEELTRLLRERNRQLQESNRLQARLEKLLLRHQTPGTSAVRAAR